MKKKFDAQTEAILKAAEEEFGLSGRDDTWSGMKIEDIMKNNPYAGQPKASKDKIRRIK